MTEVTDANSRIDRHNSYLYENLLKSPRSLTDITYVILYNYCPNNAFHIINITLCK